MFLHPIAEPSVSADDGPGLVRALARLTDDGRFRFTPTALDNATVHAVVEALRVSRDERLLRAIQELLSIIEAYRDAKPNPP